MPPHQSSRGKSGHGSRGPAASNPTPLPWYPEDGTIDPQLLTVQQVPDYLPQQVSFTSSYPPPAISSPAASYATPAPSAWTYASEDSFQGTNPQIQIQYSTAAGAASFAEGY
jgi:hypothetical protein